MNNSNLPEGALDGNGYKMVNYPANGEASDWMLGSRGIYAMSPELGTSDPDSESFFIESKETLKTVISENFKWIRYTIMKL